MDHGPVVAGEKEAPKAVGSSSSVRVHACSSYIQYQAIRTKT